MYGDDGALANSELPICDFHRMHRQKVPAVYDGATTEGVQAFMCENCYLEYGIGIGPNMGYRLVDDVLSE